MLSNKSMPDLVKIGCTSKDPKGRAKDIYETGVPTPFVVEYQALTENYKQMEQRVHQRLYSKRPNKNREFFACTVEVAVIAIKSEIGDRLIHELYEKERREKVEQELEEKRKEEARIKERRLEEERRRKIVAQAEAKRLEKKKDEAVRQEQLEWQNEWGKYLWLVAGLGLLLFYAKEKHHRETFDDNYIRTTGQVLSQRETFRHRDGVTRSTGWEIKYEFSVNGQLHKGVSRVENTNYPPITVFYRPEDPTANTLKWGDSGQNGWPAEDPVEILLIFGICSLLGGQPWRFRKWIKT